MAELFDYLQELMIEIECGRLRATDAKRRMIIEWGGVRIRDYMPKRDPDLRMEARKWEGEGIARRTAQRKVYGK